MNKFVIIALVAASVVLAAGVPAPNQLDTESSEFSLSPDDDSETLKIKGTNLEGFRDFCYQTRDYVVSDMKNRGNVFASDVFVNVFKSLGEIAQTSLDANGKATERLSKQLANPDATIDESNQDNVDHIITDGQKAIKAAGNQPEGLMAAFVSGIKSFATAGYSDAISKIMDLKSKLGDVSITQNLISFCTELSNYEGKAIEIFEATKSELVKENAAQYKDVMYNDVAPKCITSNRLSRADGFCKFVLSAKDPLSKVLNIKLPSSNSEQ